MALFVSVVELGSLRAASLKADLPAPTVTRRLQKLEEALGCRLLHRSARRLVPTPEGLQYFEQCRPLLQALQQATQSLDAHLHQEAGLVRVLAPINLANGPLRSYWSSFMRQHPSIQLELRLSNHHEDLLGVGGDVAVRAGPLPDSSLSQRRLGAVSNVLVASPDYLKSAPPLSGPADLGAHRLVVADPVTQWRFQHRHTRVQHTCVPQAHCRVNEMQLAAHMAESGVGLTYLPHTQLHARMQRGALVEALPDWQAEQRTVYVVWPQGQLMPLRVRLLVEHLVACAAADPLLQGEPALP